MCSTPVHGHANMADILLVGQAPGPHEEKLGKPFAYTAGKTLFKWLQEISSLDEDALREKIYFSAVARCFPGKSPKGGGDREPNEKEILACRKFLIGEVEILRPKVIFAVGKLAIREVLGPSIFSKNSSLTEVIGKKFFVNFHGISTYVIPLPHPSGISSWHKTEPGKSLLRDALRLATPYLVDE